jgi:hypothetical protein
MTLARLIQGVFDGLAASNILSMKSGARRA